MVAKKVLLGFFLCLFGTTVLATTRAPRLGSINEFCNLQQLSATKNAHIMQYEAGSIETWDLSDDQFKCLGISPARHTIEPNALALPRYFATPRLFFIEEGEGILGVQLPGCAETFDTGVEQEQQQQQQESTDSHQRVHRFKRGDIIAIPAGVVHWFYNDGKQPIVAIIANDLNNPANQLDMQPMGFFLAGGILPQHRDGPRKDESVSENYLNIFAGFDTELLAEAFNCDQEIVRKMQETVDRGLVVKVQGPMQFVTPDEQQQLQQPRQQGGSSSNGLEETICSAKIIYNLDNQREADVFSRQAGKLNLVNENKLPILSYLDLSAEKGYLQQNALYSPHWSMNSHSMVYVLSGDAEVQIVSNNGQAVLNQQVNKGDVFVVPQFFANTARAGENGFEWVAFKTNKSPMKSPLAGYTSVFRAMPLEVLTNAYGISPSQAQNLKTNRQTESILLSPQKTSQIS